MSKGKGWDLASLHSLEGAAEWIRKQSDALLVLVVRAEDVAFAVHPEVAPRDAEDMVQIAMEGVPERLKQQRAERRRELDMKEEKKRQRAMR